MVNLIWVFMILVGILTGALTGRMEEVNEAIFEGAEKGVALCLGLISILVFWLGLMNIAKESGILAGLNRLLSPIVGRLFPDIPKGHPAMGYILSNMTANMFGLGNAATPMGIKAMGELKKLNNDKDEASSSMITFMALNTASLTIVPTTVISIRMQNGSAHPAEIIGPTILATAISTTCALLIDWFFRRLRQRRKK